MELTTDTLDKFDAMPLTYGALVRIVRQAQELKPDDATSNLALARLLSAVVCDGLEAGDLRAALIAEINNATIGELLLVKQVLEARGKDETSP